MWPPTYRNIVNCWVLTSVHLAIHTHTKLATALQRHPMQFRHPPMFDAHHNSYHYAFTLQHALVLVGSRRNAHIKRRVTICRDPATWKINRQSIIVYWDNIYQWGVNSAVNCSVCCFNRPTFVVDGSGLILPTQLYVGWPPTEIQPQKK
jgi:hypothetical protein